MILRRGIHIVSVIGILVAVLVATLFAVRHQSIRAAVERGWKRATQRPVQAQPGDVVLAVVFDPQDHALSCEIASLKMALTYRNVHVSEDDIFALVGFDTTPKTNESSGMVWGDPHEAFVGNKDGRMLVDGYGVYWEPIARAARQWRRAQAIEGGTAAQLAEALTGGSPIVLWGYVGSGKPYQWTTPAGKHIDAISYEHAYLAYGFRGPVDAPVGFYIMDPVYGAQYETIDKFMKKWSSLGRSGVIIY